MVHHSPRRGSGTFTPCALRACLDIFVVFLRVHWPISFDLVGPGVLSDRVAAIDANRGSGNEVRSPRRQEHSRSSHFLRLTPSSSGSPGKNLVVHELHGRCSHRSRHIRLNPSWCDCIHLNVVRGEFNRHRLGQLHDRTFRCAVRGDEPGSKDACLSHYENRTRARLTYDVL